MSSSDNQNVENVQPELGILPMRNLVLFPGAVLPVEVGRKSSLRLMEDVVQRSPARLLLCPRKDPQVEEPCAEDLVDVAVEAEVLKLVRFGEGRLTALVRGLGRRHFQVVGKEPYLTAKVLSLVESSGDGLQVKVLVEAVRESLTKLGGLLPEVGRNVVPQLTRCPIQACSQTWSPRILNCPLRTGYSSWVRPMRRSGFRWCYSTWCGPSRLFKSRAKSTSRSKRTCHTSSARLCCVSR